MATRLVDIYLFLLSMDNMLYILYIVIILRFTKGISKYNYNERWMTQEHYSIKI